MFLPQNIPATLPVFVCWPESWGGRNTIEIQTKRLERMVYGPLYAITAAARPVARRRFFHVVLLAAVSVCPGLVSGKDWPTYRGDAARSGYTDEALPGKLTLRWSYHPRHAAGAGLAARRADGVRSRVPRGGRSGRVFFGSSADGKVYALDAASGEERWSFFTDAPSDSLRPSGGTACSPSAMTAPVLFEGR